MMLVSYHINIRRNQLITKVSKHELLITINVIHMFYKKHNF